MRQQIVIGCFALLTALVHVPATHAAAAPNWDLDYEVWVGLPGWDYELWIQPPGQRAYRYATYDTENQAHNDWFFLYEHNVIPPGSSVWTQPVQVIEWEYWDTYETWTEAFESAEDWQQIGFQTDIRSVYGGPLYDFSPWMPSLVPAGFSSNLQFARWLDGG